MNKILKKCTLRCTLSHKTLTIIERNMFMSLFFTKMHGAGNDFLVTFLETPWVPTADEIQALCDRQRGIGADGIIFLKPIDNQLLMQFYNCDGSKASMCGNGLRCATLFAHQQLGFPKQVEFLTDSGMLLGEVLDSVNVKIALPLLQSPQKIQIDEFLGYFLDTSVPHFVLKVDSLEALATLDIQSQGARIRRHRFFAPKGCNVNFVAIDNDKKEISVRTYERGVEAETQACGTGCAAVGAVALSYWGFDGEVLLNTFKRDQLKVGFCNEKTLYLIGPAMFVFQTEIKKSIFFSK